MVKTEIYFGSGYRLRYNPSLGASRVDYLFGSSTMRSLYALAASLGVVWAAASPAMAINIVPVFNAADNETPAFDLFNGGIQDLFDYAETYYEDIFEDPGYTLTVNFWYEDLQDTYL